MDQTNRYQSLLQQPQPILSDSDIATLQQDYQFLFLKGILGDAFSRVSQRYFSEQMAMLTDMGVDHKRLEPDSGFGTQNLPANNVVPIRTAIEDLAASHPGKRVVIVSHSKGGLDTLEALLADANPSVAGWIALQAPFAGSPLADAGAGTPVGGLLLGALLEHVFDGDSEAVANMSTAFRGQYLKDHADAIKALCASIPVLSYGSRLGPTDPSVLAGQATMLKLATGLENDGFVPEDSAVLIADGTPCGDFIRVPRISHFYPVTEDRSQGRSDDRRAEDSQQRLFAALLKVWLG